MPTHILVVDDEEKIRQTLRGVLSDEGYEVTDAGDGRTALERLRAVRPDLVILDVWLPEIDGISLLEQVRQIYADLPVIIICGHANIEAAVRATRLGAADFIEKPFSLDALLASIARALGKGERDGTSPAPNGEMAYPTQGTATVPQRTIGKSVVASGHGLHTGVRTGVILHPMPPGTGIVFQSLATEKSVPAHVDFADSTGYATTLFRGGFGAKTVEHLLATASGYGITNLLVKMEGEVPALDGSALEFCRLLDDAGVVEQSGPGVAVYEVRSRFEVREDDRTLVVEPCDGFVIDYTLDYPPPVGKQHYVFRYAGPDSFRDEIAPARTFGFVHEFTQLAAAGLAAGGRLDNCVLIGEDGIINGELRFPDEFVRHKILDVMGDFALLGRPLRARIVARATGHRHNVGMVRTLLAAA
ncbi:MAG: UDP-3-O-[3-hydroxymyristoyl] N-acetylglucosamine deacetylase [Deltaproteobacteria bacterium]|nr:UDP-3-O-[3-hydroxymyristoyl] N-acetylglucosamine deacetylase [Deltaproteobacteria bacterium]